MQNQPSAFAPDGASASKQSNQQQIRLADNIPGAEYANFMQVSHNKDEFNLMFGNIFPPSGRVGAKIITTPGHVKRMVKALQENIKKYEVQFGEIKEADVPEHGEIGFSDKK